jgi:hypothetical protein
VSDRNAHTGKTTISTSSFKFRPVRLNRARTQRSLVYNGFGTFAFIAREREGVRNRKWSTIHRLGELFQTRPGSSGSDRNSVIGSRIMVGWFGSSDWAGRVDSESGAGELGEAGELGGGNLDRTGCDFEPIFTGISKKRQRTEGSTPLVCRTSPDTDGRVAMGRSWGWWKQ